jgi:arginyl-tRNA synthetase
MSHLRQEVIRRVQQAAKSFAADRGWNASDLPGVELTAPKQPEFGDFATNFALVAASSVKRPPREIAEDLAERLRADGAFESVEVAGPGFLNLRVSSCFLAEWVRIGLSEPERLCRVEPVTPEKYLVEFVSANPNGPIHVGHGRGAAFGDSLARVLSAAGHTVSREFYVNDGVNSEQMRLFALSVRCRYRELLGLEGEFPEGGYKGDYVDEVAREILNQHGPGHAEDGPEFFQPVAQDLMLEVQRRDLERFGVVFDTWFSEQSLFDRGSVQQAIEQLRAKGFLYEKDGALWLKSSEFGDDKDRIVVRSDGRPTYIASDIAYHKDKFDRGFDRLIDIWGADHHGYIPRMAAAIEAMGYDASRFEVIVTQIVRFLEGGEVKAMSKRDGTMVQLRDLMEEIGVDVARFFYLMRSVDAHMDFDLTLAKEHSEKNPVFYVQYAHARLCSLFRKADEMGFRADPAKAELLDERPERELILKAWDLCAEIERSVETRRVHNLTTYAMDLARCYHNFYDKCRVLREEDPDRTSARLALCELTRNALQAVCHLLGISAPEEM